MNIVPDFNELDHNELWFFDPTVTINNEIHTQSQIEVTFTGTDVNHYIRWVDPNPHETSVPHFNVSHDISAAQDILHLPTYDEGKYLHIVAVNDFGQMSHITNWLI